MQSFASPNSSPLQSPKESLENADATLKKSEIALPPRIDPYNLTSQQTISEDAIPNLDDDDDDVQPDEAIDEGKKESASTAKEWSIPAVHATPRASARNAAQSTKPAKFGRRQAWIKFMAYEASIQICLDSMLQGKSEIASYFLTNGCQELRRALDIGRLMLPNALQSTGADGIAIYWDDREEGDVSLIPSARVVDDDIDEHRSIEQSMLEVSKMHVKSPSFSKTATSASSHQPKGPAVTEQQCREDASGISVEPRSPLRDGCATAKTCGVNVSPSSTPEVAILSYVLRVVGCPLLENGGSLNSGSNAKGGIPRYCVVIRNPGHQQGISTHLNATGGVEASKAFPFSPDIHHGTVLVELISCSDRQCVATGSIQAVELLRISQHTAMVSDKEESSSSSGFFRMIMGNSRRRREREQCMAWVRLVDRDGAEAGHVVLSAKVGTVVGGHLHNHPSFPSSSASSLPPSLLPHQALRKDVNSIARRNILRQASPPKSKASNAPIHNDAMPTPQNPASRPPPASLCTVDQQEGHSTYYSPQKTQLLPSVFAHRGGKGMSGGQAHTAGGFLHVNPHHVYDVLMEASLEAAGCGPSCLVISGPWNWLLKKFTEFYGVRKQYATLAYLRWVVSNDIAAPTAKCLDILSSLMIPLVHERDQMILASAELALIGHVLQRIDDLLTVCFENYFALSEDSLGGLADGALSVRWVGTPPALSSAMALLLLTRSGVDGAQEASSWLSTRIRYAARKRFQALLAATESQYIAATKRRSAAATTTAHPKLPVATDTTNKHVDSPASCKAYSCIEELCACIMNELRADESIQATNVFQDRVSLPAITAVEYIRGALAQLQKTLQQYPPPAPTPAAIGLVEAVGGLQSFVERHRYADASSRLNSKDIFGSFVQEWISCTLTSLYRAVHAFDREGPPLLQNWSDMQCGIKHRVSPLVEGMLSKIEAEMQRYQRIVNHWPSHALEIEVALVAVLRKTTSAASHQCGLVQKKEDSIVEQGKESYLQGRTLGRVAWRWIQVGAISGQDVPSALRRGMNPHQALLLNSLRCLLAVVPQLENTLASWWHGEGQPVSQSYAAFPPPPRTSKPQPSKKEASSTTTAANNTTTNAGDSSSPGLGAHWAQLVKELRTEYFACITLCAEALAGELSSSPPTSVIGILRREGLTANTDVIAKHMRKALGNIAATVRWLGVALDGRVFVALGRGLWDLAARDILGYAEDLNEGIGISSVWRGRQSAGAALHALDAFYRTELAAVMGSDLLDRDLTPPQHAQRTAALLADNTLEMNASFDVY